MQIFLIIAIILWASVTETACSGTLTTIQGPIQGSPSISALLEDCLSPVDWNDIVFYSAVPIAAGFGLLLLLAFLQDLRQAHKSNRSRPPSSRITKGNKARKERTYVIDIDYAGRLRWGSLIRWCAVHRSPGANTNPRLVRLQGTTGYSDWLSFDLILGMKSERKTVTTPRSIGKLVAVEMMYPSTSTGLNRRQLPSYNIGARLRELINRACEIEITNIQVTDAKTQDCYIIGCKPSRGGISYTEQGIITILPMLPSTSPPPPRVNYAAYYLKHGSLWTSTFMPWREGNFTGTRHITCLFACISYTMVAVQVVSDPNLEPSLEEAVVVSLREFDVTAGMVIKAAGVGALVFPLLILMEVLGRSAPTVLSSEERQGEDDSYDNDRSTETSSHDGSHLDNEEQYQTSLSMPSSKGSSHQGSDDCISRAASLLPEDQHKTIISIESCDGPSSSLPAITNSNSGLHSGVAGQQLTTDGGDTNKNNSNEVTIIEMESCDDVQSSSPSISQSETSEEANATIEDLVEVEQDRTTKCPSRRLLPILAASIHILLVLSCVLAVMWSVSSTHSICWTAFWEWVATCIIAILIQAVILDTIKAIIITIMKVYEDKESPTTPHTLIY